MQEGEKEGMKLGSWEVRKSGSQEIRKSGSQEGRKEERKRQVMVGPTGLTFKREV